MSQYMKDLASLEARKCKTCRGLGHCDDSDCGDISFNCWTCETCKGSGYDPTQGTVPPSPEPRG